MQFVVARWPAADEAADRVAASVREGRPAEWRTIVDEPGLFAAVSPGLAANTIAARLDDRGAMIFGQLFDRAATDAGLVAAARPEAWSGKSAATVARQLYKQAWGAYVVVFPDPDEPGTIEIVRDPLGALDCLTWQVDRVRIVTSGSGWVVPIVPPRGGVAWDVVARQLVVPVRASEEIALAAVVAVQPGSLCRITGARVSQQMIWSPADHCWPRRPHRFPTSAALAEMVNACVAAWAACYSRPVAELSGGLDSAIVASALRHCGAAPSRWFTYFGDAPEADERVYAQATASRLDLPLMEVARSLRRLEASDLAPLSTGFRPAMAAMDIHHDADMADRANALGADAIFTGQGGDAVFFQMPTPAVAADVLNGGIHPVAFIGASIAAAHWTRSTFWAVAAHALAARREPPQRQAAAFIRTVSADQHPWLEGATELLPAKRLQLFGLANSRVYFGETLRSCKRDMVHPLLSQPLVELVLATPVRHLTGGDRDRRLAREAFRGCLPNIVVDRHGKGDLTSYYGRLIAKSHGFLRPLLCDGLLAAAGLIDRGRLSSMLEPESLAANDVYTEILSAALIEAWLRNQGHG